MQRQTSAQLFKYEVTGGVSEYHAILRITNPRLTYAEQVEHLLAAYDTLVNDELQGAVAVFKRFFVSDAANQANHRSSRPIVPCLSSSRHRSMVPRLPYGYICKVGYTPVCFRMVTTR